MRSARPRLRRERRLVVSKYSVDNRSVGDMVDMVMIYYPLCD